MSSSAIGMWLVASVLGSILTVQAASVTLAWDPPSPSTEVTGYKLYYGPADTSGSEWYTEVVDVHNVTKYTLQGLTVGTWYVFAVQAYGDDGKRSDFSTKIRHFVAAPELMPSVLLRVVAVDSEETEFENAAGGNALDGNPNTFWHTKWFGQDPPHPHQIIMDLGAVRTVYGISVSTEGALINSRCTHQTTPKKGAKTKWAASMKKTARVPDLASSNLGSRLFFKSLLCFHVRLCRDHPDLPRLHAQCPQQYPYLCRLAYHARQFRNLGGGFRHRRRRVLLKVGFEDRPMWRQFTLGPIVIDLFQLLDPTCHIRVEIAMEARFRNTTQPDNVMRGDPLTALPATPGRRPERYHRGL